MNQKLKRKVVPNKKKTKLDPVTCREVYDNLSLIKYNLDESVFGYSMITERPVNKAHKRLMMKCESALVAVDKACFEAYKICEKYPIK